MAAIKKEAQPELPQKIRLDQDVIYWIKTVNGIDFTRQFYANQVITDPVIIAEIIERNYPFS